MTFYKSDALAPIRESVVYVTEEASAKEKEYVITRATVSGQITLLTRTFGRGTDFVCKDQTVNDEYVLKSGKKKSGKISNILITKKKE